MSGEVLPSPWRETGARQGQIVQCTTGTELRANFLIASTQLAYKNRKKKKESEANMSMGRLHASMGMG